MATKNRPLVAIIMGSSSDHPTLKGAEEALTELNISFELKIVSAHRTPEEMVAFAKSASKKGLRVIIAGAGGAAHLPGMVASLTELPVIGVPVAHGVLEGKYALLSIVQMPKGIPVATVGISNSYNAGLLAARILASGKSPADRKIQKKLIHYRETLRKKVKNQKI